MTSFRSLRPPSTYLPTGYNASLIWSHLMSDRVTRKRSHPEEEEQSDSQPATKRGPPQNGSAGTEHHCSGPTSNTQADGQAIGGASVKQDEEFWFDDGTVILVARDIEFRVYRGVLAGLSSVFKDLFAEHHAFREVCMNIQGVPTFPCPVVHVSDSPEDLRHLLRACFPKRLGRFVDKVTFYNARSVLTCRLTGSMTNDNHPSTRYPLLSVSGTSTSSQSYTRNPSNISNTITLAPLTAGLSSQTTDPQTGRHLK